MEDTNQRKTMLPRLGTKKNNGAGEIVEVHGGHIVRSTGRKDRHSKVCTAKGPRDRRVRLSAHTAIQFYDVQDRLGYDRPSKAVDWLIKKAKSAIDELAELPAWDPHTVTRTNTRTRAMHNLVNEKSENPNGIVDNRSTTMAENHIYLQNLQRTEMENSNGHGSSSFLPPYLHSDSIADTIKSYIVPFQSYLTDYPTRNSLHSEDLQLSLQALNSHGNDHVLFSTTAPPTGGFDGWPEQQNHPALDINRFQRMFSWNSGETDTVNGNSSGEFVFSSSLTQTLPPPPPPLQPFFGESQFFSQRGPLQSSNTPFLRAFPVDPSQFNNQTPTYFHQPSFPGPGFASGGFSGYFIPARIQGEEELDGISDKPSSVSSDSRH